MSDKKYQFELTEKQVDMINKLIKNEFQLADDMNEPVINGVELISLASYLNYELALYKGCEEFKEVVDD